MRAFATYTELPANILYGLILFLCLYKSIFRFADSQRLGELRAAEARYLAGYSKGSINSMLGDPEITASIYCKSSTLPNTDTQNYSTDLR